jgi:surface antigen/LysM repeat protein
MGERSPSAASGGVGRVTSVERSVPRSLEVLFVADEPDLRPEQRTPRQVRRSEPEPDEPVIGVAYRVRPGDTVAGVAKQFRLSVESVLANNPEIQDPNVLIAGSELQIPAANGIIYTVAPGDTVAAIAAVFEASPERIRRYPANGLSGSSGLVAGKKILVPGGKLPAIESPALQPPTPEPPVTETPALEPTPDETPATDTPSVSPDAIPVGPGHSTDGVNLRFGPGTDFDVIVVIPVNSDLFIGEASGGFYAVTYGSYNGWAAGEFLATGPSPAPAPDVSTPDAPVPATPVASTPGWDDYPYPAGDGIDPWGFALANCTSFVAWRINNVLGISFDAYAFGGYWGDAGYWDATAASVGFLVDDVASPGAIAQWRGDETVAGFGHVAYVMSVNGDGSANIEEYNAVVPLGYSQRTVFAPRYIHFVQ